MARKEYTYEEICRAILAKNFSPIYFLMGEEPFFIDKITDLLVDHVLSESERDFNQLIFYGADTDVASIINAAKRFPMMSEYQLIIVKEAQQLRNLDLLANYAKKILKSTILIINYKYKNYDSSQMLADFLGNDLTRIDKELDKLSIILNEEKNTKITPELVETNIGISKEYNNFELLKAIISKDTLKVYRIAQYFEKNPQSNPIQVTLSVLFNYFSNLLICYYTKNRSESGLMAALGLRSNFQTKDYILGLRQYPPMKVFNLIGEIRTADALSKGVGNTSMGNSDILKELLYKILH